MGDKPSKPCSGCGKLCYPSTHRGAPSEHWCRECRRARPAEHGTRRMYREKACRCDVCRDWNRQSQRAYKAATLKDGSCERCGSPASVRYCSWECRSAAKGGRVYISRSTRLAVYERDGWKCQLCDEPVDRDAAPNTDWAPTLDHVVPKSHQLVPDHSPANLRTTHRWCNSIRRDGRVPDEFFKTREAS